MLLKSIVAATTFMLIALFTYTALSKLFNVEQFVYTLQKSPLLKTSAGVISIALPVLELIIVGLLMIPTTRQKGLIFSGILMSVFTIYIAYMLLTQSDLPCSCGGIINQLSWPAHLSINMILTLFTIISVVSIQTQRFIAINRYH